MFDLNKVKKYQDEFIHYEGYLPYSILAVLGYDATKKRFDHLRSLGGDYLKKEQNDLKIERRKDKVKWDNLRAFLTQNPKYRGIVKNEYQKYF